MAEALIGYTGFVGNNLDQQRPFSDKFNSSNIGQMRGRTFDTVYCAGVKAVKWWANKNPDEDRAGIKALEDVLTTVTARQFVLISTIDVYPTPQGFNENDDMHGEPNHVYGTNRLAFEDFCNSTFQNCTIVRLPALFGNGLKKNVLFDLMNDNMLDNINPACSFQYYNLDDTAADIDTALKNNIKLVNLFTQPLKTQAIIDAYFPGKKVGANAGPELHYDLHTRHAGLWGKSGNYIRSADDVLAAMGRFIQRTQQAAA